MEWKIVGAVWYYHQECQWDSWRKQYQKPFLKTYSHSSCKGLTVCSARNTKLRDVTCEQSLSSGVRHKNQGCTLFTTLEG